MKQIKQTVEVAFKTIEITDAIVLAPLMDAIRKSIEDKRKGALYETLPDEEKDKYYREDGSAINHYSNKPEEIFAVLANLGFVCSDGIVDLLNPSIEDLKLKYKK